MNRINLNDNDVVFMEKDSNLTRTPTSRVDELMKFIGGTLKSHLGAALKNQEQWLSEGVPCQVLQPSGQWQAGRIRLRIEFIPETQDEAGTISSINEMIRSE